MLIFATFGRSPTPRLLRPSIGLPLAGCPTISRRRQYSSIPSSFDDAKPVAAFACRAWRYAAAAAKLAERTGVIDVECAWVCGMLAPLGWLAMAASDSTKVQACLDDPEFLEQPAEVERTHWSLDQDAIARRLARRWDLPKWVSAIVGRLALAKEVAENLGCDLPLFRAVQAAVLVVNQQGDGLRLDVSASIHEAVADLGLSAADFDAVSLESTQAVAAMAFGQTQYDDPLLPEFLKISADNCQLRRNKTLEDLEEEQDQLHQLLRGGRQADTDRLQAMKLEALAEFAAGAAHEINNPLAVIFRAGAVSARS